VGPGVVPARSTHGATTWERRCGGGTARVLFTDRTHGDLSIEGPPAPLAARRRAAVPLPWSWLRQVHGADVVVVDAGPLTGRAADAQVTSRGGVALAIHTADCGPIALTSPQGVVGVAHAGWRGLRAGVVAATVDAMRSLGAGRVDAWIGPCIHPGCYEFGETDLASLAQALGPCVRSTTAGGAPALDLPAAITAALVAAGVESVEVSGACTACEPRFYSHRARGESGRQALVAWLEEA
jgi:polyphenol oxidase